MTVVELSLLAGSLIVAVLIVTLAVVHRRKGKLPAPVILFLRLFLGFVFVILGVIGSLLPVLQGWLFFLIAALILFPQSRFAVKACDKVEPRMPRLIGRLRRWGIGVPKHE